MVWAPVRKQRFKHLALRWGFDEQCAEQTVQARPIELRLEREQLSEPVNVGRADRHTVHP
jgi:hypothetical protein